MYSPESKGTFCRGCDDLEAQLLRKWVFLMVLTSMLYVNSPNILLQMCTCTLDYPQDSKLPCKPPRVRAMDSIYLRARTSLLERVFGESINSLIKR